MFRYIKQNENNIKTLFIKTWLLNINAFNRLFPKEFVKTSKVLDTNNCFFDNSHWGQFLDKDFEFKKDIATTFRKNFKTKKYKNLNKLFPLPARISRLNLEKFFEFYKIY